MNRLVSDFLTATPTSLTGAGTVLNLAGNYCRFNSSPTGRMADTRALFMDWAMVGQDLQDSMEAFEKEQQLTFSFAS